MPTLRTVIRDLYHNEVRGVGGGFNMLGTRVIPEYGTLSGADHVKQYASPAHFSFGMRDFKYIIDVDPADYPQANGFALFFDDGWSTLATLTRAQRIAGGGGYSGCLYSVYNVGNGQFKCVHTARPNAADPDVYVNQLRNYAHAQHWVLVHEVPTIGGVGVNGCVTTFLMTRISYTLNPVRVRTVRLRLDRFGFSVGRDRWDDPA
jgi:hypothetical protein